MATKKDKLIDLEQLQIVSKNKQKQIDDLKEKKVNKEEGKNLSSNDFTDSYKNQVEANTTSIAEIKDGITLDSFRDVETALDNGKNYANNIYSLATNNIAGKDTSTNILSKSSDTGIWVGTDTNHWYYWNGTQYVSGGTYQATQIADESVSRDKLDDTLKYNNDNGVKANKVYDYFKTSGNLIPNGILETYENKYAYKNTYLNNIIYFGDNTSYVAYKLDYIDGETYYFDSARYVDVVDIDNNVIYEGENLSTFTGNYPNGKYLYVSINNANSHYISLKRVKTNQNNFVNPLFTNNFKMFNLKSKYNIYPNEIYEIIPNKYAYKSTDTGLITMANSSSYQVCKIKYKPYMNYKGTFRFFDIVDHTGLVLNEYEYETDVDIINQRAEYIYITLSTDDSIIYASDYNSYINIPNSVKDMSISASCDYNNNNLKLCLYGTNNDLKNYVEVTSTEIIIWSILFGTPYETRTNHNLVLENNVQININIITGEYCDIELISNGEKFTLNGKSFDKMGLSYFAVETDNVNVNYSLSIKNIKKDNWIFGDSYVSNSSDRWIYYLYQNNNYDNYLVDGYSGEGSNNSILSLKNLLYYGVPKNVFWFLGMNDGSDTDIDTPSTTWLNAFNELKTLSEEYGFNIVLGTIPTVPSVNNEGKNNTIRNSGYDYIDFAKSVGANSSGVWYSGMLSSDEVHPTVKGALALYGQFITSVPEIKIN